MEIYSFFKWCLGTKVMLKIGETGQQKNSQNFESKKKIIPID